MKRIVKSSFLVLALLGLMFSSCKKEYDRPPFDSLPIGEIVSIDSILSMESGTVFTEDASVYGIITADEKSGNLYKAAFLQDRATGKAIELYMNATSGVRIGDSVRVYLKDVTYAMYNGLPQLSNFEPDGHIIILANDKPITPVETTIADIVAGNHLAGLVRLNNVKFLDKGTFADVTGYGDRTLMDPTNPTQSVVVRTSSYANFAQDSLPQGIGNLVAIASHYKTSSKDVWQLIVRSATELEFDDYHPTSELPYFQSFATGFGTYSTYSVVGDQTWVIDYSTAKMTGHTDAGNFANEDWLISSPVTLKDINHAKVCVNYAAQYQNSNAEDLTLQVSSDYSAGMNPLDAHWTQLNVTYPNTNGWNFETIETSLDEFLGEKVTVAMKFLSSASQSRTVEINYILIMEGEAGGGPNPPGPNPGGEVQSMPYSQDFETDFGTYITKDVLGAQSWTIKYGSAWISGHEGGSSGADYANEDWLISSPVKIEGVQHAKAVLNYAAKYNAPVDQDVTMLVSTNYAWDSDPASADWTVLMSDIENNSPGNTWTFTDKEASLDNYLGQTVTVAVKYVSTTNGARTFEIKNITVQEGDAGGPTPPPGPTPGGEVQSMPYSQSFETEFGTYLTKDKLGAQSWTIKYKSAWISGHEGGSSGSDYANEDWLISSPVKIEGVEHAKAVMNYAAKYNAPVDQDVTMLVSTNYAWDSDPASADWTVLMSDIENNSPGNTWTFTDKEASLDNYLGQTVTVAVKYLSTTSGARTIEIQTITVQEGETGVGPTPPPGPGDEEGSGTAEDPYNVAAGIAHQNANNSQNPENTEVAWVRGFIVGSVKANHSTVTANEDVAWEAPFELATNVVIADDPGCREISQCLFVNLPAGKPLREIVNLVNTPDNLGKRLTVLGKLYTYFGKAGLRDSNGQETDFVLEGYVPPTPPDPEGFFSESFMYGQGDFTIQNVVMPEGLNYVWAHNASYQCMKASSKVSGVSYATESWLVSPPIALPFWNFITLTFEQAVNYASHEGMLSVMVSTDYDGDVTRATWTELNLDSWPAGNNWDFSTSSTTDLTSYMEQTVVIGFKYTSTSSINPAWEIKNLVVF